MPIIALLGIAAQVFFAVHVVKTGRDRYWLFIIILFPVIGCLVYLVAEYLPDLQRNYKMQTFQSGIVRALSPTRRLRQLEDQVELTPSLKNKELLAQEYVNTGMFDKAISIYKECMLDAPENDIALIEGLCWAYYCKKDLDNAKKCLEMLLKLRGNRKGDEFDLLYARTLEERGDTNAALTEYAEVFECSLGEEARCRYALLLKKVGRPEEANALFDEILRNVRLSTGFYAKTEKPWVRIAKKERTSSAAH